MLLSVQWNHTKHNQLIPSLNSLGIKYFLLDFYWAPTWRERLGVLKDDLLVSTWTAWQGRALTPGKFLLTATVSQVKRWFHFPQKVTVHLIPAMNRLPGRKDCVKVCVNYTVIMKCMI